VATFGYTSAGSSDLTLAGKQFGTTSNRNGNAHEPASAGTLDSISAFLKVTSGESINVSAIINEEDSNGANSHDQIALKENTVTRTAYTTAETFTLNDEAITATSYISNVYGNGNNASGNGKWCYLAFDTTGGSNSYFVQYYATYSVTDPWDATDSGQYKYSIYATYTPSSSDPKPSVSDATTVSESVSVQVSAPQVNASDATTVGESVSASVSAVGAITTSVSDSVTTGESRNVTVSNSQISVSDGTTVGESRNVTVSAPQINVSDAVGVAESVNVLVSVIGVLVMSVLESVSVSESVSVEVAVQEFIEASASDGVTVGEAVSATVSGGSVSVSDGVTILDVAQAIVSSPQINVSDGTTVGEVVEVEEDVFQVNVDDSSTVGESVGATVSDLFIDASENINVGESSKLIAGTEYNANPTNYTGINLDQDVFIMQGLPRMSTWGENTRPVNPPLGTYGFNESTGRIEIYTSSGWMDLMKTGLFIGSTAPDSPVEGNLWIDTS
jgi:hypothetical protein